MYLDHRTVDSKCNMIVDCHITKGNVHDSVPYISRLEYIKNKFGFNIKEVGIDSGYDFHYQSCWCMSTGSRSELLFHSLYNSSLLLHKSCHAGNESSLHQK